MGKYVLSQLVSNEKIVFETKLFWLPVFSLSIILMPVIIGFLLLIPAYLNYVNSEFAVTNKRVILKTGVISRRSLELNLTKIESVYVNQGMIQRILGYGKITVIGTGGTKEYFSGIANVMEFRKAIVEEQNKREEKVS